MPETAEEQQRGTVTRVERVCLWMGGKVRAAMGGSCRFSKDSGFDSRLTGKSGGF